MHRSCAVFVLVAAAATVRAAAPRPTSDTAAGCVAVLMPTVEGVSGNAVEVATGIRDLIVGYLAGPSTKAMALDAKLPSQAIEEAKQKGCEPILFTTVTKKSGGGRLTKAFAHAAGSSTWYLPGGGSAVSAGVRAATAAGLQVVSSMAESTKTKDEIRLEYRLQSTAGQVQFGPNTEARKASADGEDVLTPVIMRAAEAIVTRKVGK